MPALETAGNMSPSEKRNLFEGEQLILDEIEASLQDTTGMTSENIAELEESRTITWRQLAIAKKALSLSAA